MEDFKVHKTMLNKLIAASVSLSTEKDSNVLLQDILTAAMDITSCDAGTLYIKNNNTLDFKIMITKSMNNYKGGKFSEIQMPSVSMKPTNVCAKSLIDRKLINIKDLSKNSEFDFIGPKKYDSMTGYKTKSMLVIPMEDNTGEQIGVLQLMNALNENGEVIAFDKKYEVYISALASLAAASIVNLNHKDEMRELLESLVGALSTAIYIRTPYNVTHTQNMVKYGEKFIEKLNELNLEWNFDEQKKREFLMSIWLHDVGKLTIPLEIMNKETRLGEALERVETRFEIISLLAKLNEAKTGQSAATTLENIKHAKKIIHSANFAGFLGEELENEIMLISSYKYTDCNKEIKPWLNEDEIDSLLIKKGTLTFSEREVMESHVLMTEKILNNVKFSTEYQNVPKWASQHHEFINKMGYPNKLEKVQLDKEARLLTIIDVFDGLSATDRPYKKAIPLDRVILILKDMEEEGKLDSEILDLFLTIKPWE